MSRLPEGTSTTRAASYSAAAASESELPEVITEHWLPILRREGLLVECPPDQFTAPADWIPLYTCEGLQKYLPAALSVFLSQGTPSLIAVAPPEFHVGTDKEFLLCNFHRHQCHVRQLFNLKGRCRQLAFVPTAELLMRTPTQLSAMSGSTLTSSLSVEVVTLRVSSMDRP